MEADTADDNKIGLKTK